MNNINIDVTTLTKGLDNVPTWAYSFCNIFVLMAFGALFTGIFTLVNSARMGFILAAFQLTSISIQVATCMTLFWMCRSSLRTATY